MKQQNKQQNKQRNDLSFYDASASEWWDESAKIFALHHLNPPRFAYFDRHIPQWKGLTVLDVGCGGGFTCEYLARRGAIVSGVDQSYPCIQTARLHAEQMHLAIAYEHGYGESLPYADHTFDVVTCVDVLEHVKDLQQTLSEIYRVLKPGGVFCFDTINRTLKARLIMIELLENGLRQIPVGLHDWNKFIQPQELVQFLDAIGFQSTEIRGFNVFGETLIDYIAAYRYYLKTKNFRVSINDDVSVMYIGKTVR